MVLDAVSGELRRALFLTASGSAVSDIAKFANNLRSERACPDVSTWMIARLRRKFRDDPSPSGWINTDQHFCETISIFVHIFAGFP